MNKHKLKIVFALAIFAMYWMGPIRAQVVVPCSLMEEDFDNGFTTANNWQISANNNTTFIPGANGSSSGLRLFRFGSTSTANGVWSFFNLSQPESISFYISPSSCVNCGSEGLFAFSHYANGGYVGILINGWMNSGNDQIYFARTNSNWQYNYGNISSSHWFKIELRDIDWTAKNYDLYIDGVLEYSNFPFYTTNMNGVNIVDLYNNPGKSGEYDEIAINGNPLSISSFQTDPLCAGGSTGSIAVNVQGGQPGYTYQWNTGGTSATLANLPGGAYSVQITDQAGCQDSLNFTLTNPAPLGITLEKTAVSCPNGMDGGIQAQPMGGTPGYQYQWSNGSQFANIAGLQAGVYSLTVTDMNNCQLDTNVLVSEPPPIHFSPTLFEISCNGDQDGTIQVQPSGGTSPYTYLWNTGGTSNSLINQPAGLYQLTLTDDNACQDDTLIELLEPDAILSGAQLTQPTTGGSDGAIDLAVSGGTPPFGFFWSTGASSEDVTNLAAGVYSVIITDANGCTKSDTFELGTVGLDPMLSEQLDITVWPNPTKDVVQVRVTQVKHPSITIVNAVGQEINPPIRKSSGSDQTTFTIDFTEYSKGMYRVRISGDQILPQGIGVLRN